MIWLKSPSIAINSHDVPGPIYRMTYTIDAPEGMSAAQTVQHILTAHNLSVARGSKQLKNVVINCHGAKGGGALYIGGESHDMGKAGIRLSTLGSFALLKPFNIGTIWLVACQAAIDSTGRTLCQELAKACGCLIIASDEDQEVGAWGTWRLLTSAKFNHIDEFEGTVYGFYPTGEFRPIDPHSEAVITTMDWE